MRKIQFETRTHQGGSKKYFLASPAKFGQLYVKHTPSEILNLWHVLHTPLDSKLQVTEPKGHATDVYCDCFDPQT
jgi:hypothetical protein